MEDRTAGFHPGQMVTAIAGRESGRSFVIVGLDAQFLFLADGKQRTVRRAKRKNPRHVRSLAGKNLDNHLQPGLPLTDEVIRQVLRAAEEEG